MQLNYLKIIEYIDKYLKILKYIIYKFIISFK